jgi:hypothetical protein
VVSENLLLTLGLTLTADRPSRLIHTATGRLLTKYKGRCDYACRWMSCPTSLNTGPWRAKRQDILQECCKQCTRSLKRAVAERSCKDLEPFFADYCCNVAQRSMNLSISWLVSAPEMVAHPLSSDLWYSKTMPSASTTVVQTALSTPSPTLGCKVSNTNGR